MKYNIIIIDDSPDYRALLELHIQRGCKECQVESYDPVARGKPDADFAWSKYDVALLDYDLGGENGLDWLAEFNSLPGFPPVIFMTGEGSERIAARAIKFGAEDYLPKNEINGEAIIEAINSAAQAWDAKPSAKDEKKHFLEILERARETTDKCQPALFFMEIDQSSAILEAEGPRFLARVTKDATDIIRAAAKKMGINCHVFNYSDHEMAFVLPDGADEAHCRKIGKKICQEVTESQFEYTNQTLTCTCSIGIASITKQDIGVRDVIKKADAACRAARIRGGNSFYYFPAAMKPPQAQIVKHQTISPDKPVVSIPPVKEPVVSKPVTKKSVAKEPVTGLSLSALSAVAAKLFTSDPADKAIADLLRANREQIGYTAYAPIDDEQDSSKIENLFHLSPYCMDFAGKEVDTQSVIKAAREHALDIDLDMTISKFAIKQALQYRQEHNHRVVMVCSLVSASLRRLDFFQQLFTLLKKLPDRDICNALVFRISIVDYVSQPKEFIEILVNLREQTNVRFCITGIRDDESFKLCRHRNVFDFVELSVLTLENTDDVMIDRVAEVLNGTSIKLIITGIDSSGTLMQTLMYAPDYIQGDFVAMRSDKIELGGNAVTHIEM